MTAKPIEEVVQEMAQVLGVERSAWSSRRRSDGGSRAVAAYAARRLLGYRRGEVADSLGYRSPSSVAHAERRVEGDRKLIKQAGKAARAVEKKAE